ncbi:MAG: exonuclease domain-containing protein [Eubacterium sp.]|nr:exonuclease domain-containing protein [Eubacterium sp.]
MYYIIFDFEWNNAYSHIVHNFMNEIIEIGAVKLDEKLNIVDTFKQMITPELTKKLSGRCKNLTGITNEELKENGIRFKDAFSDFARWSAGDNNVFMSWSNSDLYVLSGNFLQHFGNCKVDFMRNYCDVQKYCMAFVKRDEEHKNNQIALSKCAEEFGVEVDTEKLHRALADCYVTAECFRRVFDREKLSGYINSCDSSFFERLLFKPYYITSFNSSHFDINSYELNCPSCGKPLKKCDDFTVQNKAFKGAVKCRKCRRTYWAFVRAKKTYDDVVVKTRFVEMNKKRARRLNNS